jgi:CPA2 family monovalent cation:H+ antiporter-2
MHATNDFLRNLALVMGVAAVTTVVFQRLRLPVVFGYMLAGLIIGPHLPIPLVADPDMVHTLSELGVILLMFHLGLEFSLRRLAQAGGPMLVVAALECSVMLLLGYQAGRFFGWSPLASLFAGSAIAISSTTIIVKAFADQSARGRFTELVLGLLIVEDLIAILLLAMLTPASSGPSAAAPAASLGVTVVRLVAFLAGLTAVGMLIVPRLVRSVVRLQRSEITLVVSVGICFATALLAQAIGYSVALGAFLAGSFVAESGESKVIEKLIEPLRDMFVAVFFVSVGMMIDPDLVRQHWLPVLLFTLLVMVGKIGAVSTATFLTGADTRTAVQTGMSMAQIGEFSFIIAGAGLASGATAAWLYPVMIAVSAITSLTTPWFIRFADPVAGWVDKNLPRPLQTFAALYGTWLESMRSRPGTSAENVRLRRALRGLALDACVIAALSIGASVMAHPLQDRVMSWTGLPPFGAQSVVAGTAVVLSLPFLVGIFRTGRALGQILSLRAFPEPAPKRLDLAAAPRRAMIVAIQLLTVLVVGAPLVAITQPFLPPFLGFSVFVVGLLIMGAFVWRTAADLQGHVRAAAEGMVEAIGRHARAPDAQEGERSLQRAYQVLPGLGEPVPVRIDGSSRVVGQSLAEIGLRGQTGATIIAISRGEDVVLVPDGHVVLQAGDVVALAGTRTSIDGAREMLERGKAG